MIPYNSKLFVSFIISIKSIKQLVNQKNDPFIQQYLPLVS